MPGQERHFKGDNSDLEQRLGYKFKDSSLLTEALTHSSYAHEHPERHDNERLEFLGDKAFDLIVSDILFHHKSHFNEGEMTQRRARVVCKEAWALLAQSLQLEDCILVGHHWQSKKLTHSMLADALEAVAGALYLDGGLLAVRGCFETHLRESIKISVLPIDHKSSLQEFCHRLSLGQPKYELLYVEGPAHERNFAMAVEVDGVVKGEGAGASKKIAAQNAAEVALKIFSKTLPETRFNKKQEQH